MRAAVTIGATLAALGVGIASAYADSVPFTDTNINGYIGLCNHAGDPVTSGSVTDAPFVWTAVASTPTPSGYEGGKATLFYFQPRQGVDPGDWSGRQMTGSSTYTNTHHPMAQSTPTGQSLEAYMQAFPPEWDGLIELRMYFSAYNMPTYGDNYPATVLKVSGDRWKVVQGGTADCHAGTAVSAGQRFENDHPSSTNRVSASPQPASTSPGSTAPGGSAAGSSGGATNASSTTKSGSSVGLGVGIGAGVVVLGGLAAWYLRRRASAAKV